MSGDSFKKNILFIIGLMLITLGAVIVIIGNTSGGTACFAAGIVIILFSQFDVKSIKVFDMAFELQNKINEADEILAKLRGISLPVSEIAIMSASRMGWVQEPLSNKQLHDYVASISKELEGMKVDKDAIDNAKRAWYAITINQLATTVIGAIRTKLLLRIQEIEKLLSKNSLNPGDVTAEQAESNSKLFSDAHTDLISFNKDVEKMRGVVDISIYEWLSLAINKYETIPQLDKDELQKKLSEHLLDLEFFITHKKLRRSEVWLSQ